MGYVVRYSTSNINKTRRKGNAVIGVDSGGYSKTSESGFYAGVPPVAGKHNVVRVQSSGDPDFYVLDDSELINLANQLGGSVSTTTAATTYLASRDDIIFTDNVVNNTTTDGLVLELDFSNLSSYPSSGTTVYDLNGDHNAILNNGPTFNSNKYISFDGVNDYGTFSNEYSFNSGNGTDYTFELLFKMRTLPTSQYGANGHIWGGENGNDIVLYLNPSSSGVSKGIIVHDDSRYNSAMMTNGGFEADTWSHWVVVQDGTNNTVTHYINGELDRGPTDILPTSQYVKSWGGTRFAYDARWGTYSTLDLAIARQYTKQLSADEVAQNYYGGDIITKDSSIFRHFTDTGNLVGQLNSTTLPDISGVGSDFTTEGTVDYDDSYGGVLHLNSGRIYRDQLGWYGKMAVSWWMKYDGAVNAKPFYTENYRDSGGCSRISSPINSNGTFTFSVWDNSSHSAGLGGSKATTTTTNVCDGEWHQVTCQWSNGTGNQPRGMYVYVNGQQEGYIDAVGNDGGYQHWHLGGSYGCVGDNTHNCYLGPVMFYKNYNLTDAEVLQNYNAHKARFK